MRVDVKILNTHVPVAQLDHIYDIEHKAADSTHSYSRYVLYGFHDGQYTTCSYRADFCYLTIHP